MGSSPVEAWSEARYWGFIRAALRRAFGRYPPKYAVLAQSRCSTKPTRHTCRSCAGAFPRKGVAVDHIEPLGSLLRYSHLPVFVKRLFCPLEGLQVLCKECHHRKTMKERGMTDVDIALAQFKAGTAAQQIEDLTDEGLFPGSNQAKRVAQKRKLLLEEGTPSPPSQKPREGT